MRHWILDLLLLASRGGKADEEPGGGETDDDTAAPVDDTGDSGGTDDDPWRDHDVCAELGLDERPWEEAADDDALHATAADVTIPVMTVDGRYLDWSLAENWSGCEVYLFLSQDSRQLTSAYNYTDETLFLRDVRQLLERAPDNTIFFFLSGERDEDDRQAALAVAYEETLEALDRLGGEEGDWWRDRVLFVQERDQDLEGWLGSHFKSPDWGVGIDRFQSLRYMVSYGDPGRYDNSYGWFLPNLEMAANEAVYYDFEYDRQVGLDAQDATVVPVFDQEVLSDPGWAGVRGEAVVDLPEGLDEYDGMAFDLTLACNGEGEYGTCPAWDYLVYLFQHSEAAEDNPYGETACEAGATLSGPCLYADGQEADGTYTCNEEGTGYGDLACPSREIGRWITTYHREGRWVHDVSGLLPLLGQGGRQTWSFYTQQEYVVDLDVRLLRQGEATRPRETTLLFSGGSFDTAYNDRDAVTVSIPAEATRVELATVLSGHGQVSPGNCAEFCETTHVFTVNGEYTNTIALSEAGTSQGCMDKVNRGVVPNQYGTWWYGRSGWCPGWEVPVEVTDITDRVTPGAENTFEYAGYYRGDVYTSGGANIVLAAFLVVSW